jgi:hypothetical protein
MVHRKLVIVWLKPPLPLLNVAANLKLQLLAGVLRKKFYVKRQQISSQEICSQPVKLLTYSRRVKRLQP